MKKCLGEGRFPRSKEKNAPSAGFIKHAIRRLKPLIVSARQPEQNETHSRFRKETHSRSLRTRPPKGLDLFEVRPPNGLASRRSSSPKGLNSTKGSPPKGQDSKVSSPKGLSSLGGWDHRGVDDVSRFSCLF
jgi:hypothetical protein